MLHFSNSTAVWYKAARHELRCVWSRICGRSESEETWYFETNCNECNDDFLLRVKLRRHVLARSQWSIGTAIRGASVISFSVCVCVLCLFLSHTFSNFQMSQSGTPKPAPATCLYIYYNILVRAKLRKKCHNYIHQIFKSVTLVVFWLVLNASK